ncbi:aspartyl/asparaginyl beta-hydroxylase domain-containing protein [Pseudoxanthomonas sp.]|uniref:aspartyl/asparaginyl beta-hydroxylase domain-containing protein n=2 Tax=Pseudoxanthomonas TaxID=83618 RepID=UPI00258B0C70|nr:aspartyl/asparaginyl beta-hydroxylase domain-containing protein [Pseudoxanthomonas sp.]
MSAPQASLTQAAAQLMDQGVEWMQQGQPGRAADCWRRVVEMTPDFAPALNSLGAYYLSQERFEESQALLERAVAAAPDLAIAHANLSRIHSLRGEAELALKAIDRAIRAEPASWGPHMEKARLLEAAGRHREASRSWNSALAYMPEQMRRSPHLQTLIGQASAAVREDQEQLRNFLLDRLHGVGGRGDHRALERFNHCLDIVTGRRSFVTARPLTLPFPRLPAIPFFHPEDYDWVPKVEAAFPHVLQELQGVLDQRDRFTPYVQTPPGQPKGQFAALDRTLDWGAFFLWKNGERIDDHANLCPQTEAALIEHAPLNTVRGRAPVAFFSALKPGTHIPPHNGATNTRLTVHLPLIVPRDCALRVGEETHVWQPGKLVMFDDTIEHEAWNFSDQLRVVLIFDIWHPMLTDLEKRLVAHTVEGIMAYYGEGADLGEL